MTWRDVFDCKRAGTVIDDAAKMARAAGYRFLAFNGEVYFFDPDGQRHRTGLHAGALDRTVVFPE